MRLSRRDALAALAGLTAAGGSVAIGALATRDPPVASDGSAGTAGRIDDSDADTDTVDEDTLSLLVAAAEVLYPSETTGHRPFVETYLQGRLQQTPDHYASVASVAAELDAVARDWHDAGFDALSRKARDQLLRDLGVDVADAAPDGNLSDRLRFFVVNDLLYAFYTSPTGGELVGIENPTGYPGGTESYQRGPEGVDDE